MEFPILSLRLLKLGLEELVYSSNQGFKVWGLAFWITLKIFWKTSFGEGTLGLLRV